MPAEACERSHGVGSPYTLTFSLGIATDLAGVHAVEPAALAAVEAILDDLAHGRVTGKLLGDRRVSGDLTGLARVKFDVAGQRPQRFRLIYRQVDPTTRDVLAIGQREEHAIYRLAVTNRTVEPPEQTVEPPEQIGHDERPVPGDIVPLWGRRPNAGWRVRIPG